MPVTAKPLPALTAGDLMTAEVVRVRPEMPLREAARLLLRHRIGGVPVVDAHGKCVGVLSGFDFLRAGPTCGDADEVRRFMTADPVTVTPATPLRVVAQMMVDAHIHRVIVVDEEQRPVGIVASTDALAALAFARGWPDAG
jgi:CBS domain-containing protein